MMIARKNIVFEPGYLHLTWRCHNHQHYLSSRAMKKYVMEQWLKYKARYRVKIFAYTIMNNHIHLIAWVDCAQNLSAFMRSTNSAIAKAINRFLGKDSSAIKDRYISAVIQDEFHFFNAIAYTWLNPWKGFRARPESYEFSSAFYIHRGTKDPLIDDDDPSGWFASKKLKRLLKRLLRSTLDGIAEKLFSETLRHRYSIGSQEFITARWLTFKKLGANST